MSTENDLTKTYSGIFGNQVVLRNRRGKSVMTIPATRPKTVPTERQERVRKNFCDAAVYARNALKIPDRSLAYSAKAKASGLSAHVVAMTDFLHSPEVREIITRDYEGKPGDLIHVVARDDFKVAKVIVSILDPKGEILEKGICELDPLTSRYDYTVTVLTEPLKGVVITAEAFDYPDHMGMLSVTL